MIIWFFTIPSWIAFLILMILYVFVDSGILETIVGIIALVFGLLSIVAFFNSLSDLISEDTDGFDKLGALLKMIFYGAIVGYIVLRTITGYQDEKTNTQAKYDSNKYKVTYVHEDYDFNDLPLVDVKNITYKSKNDENWNLMTSSRKGHIVRYAGGEFKYLKICSTELQKSKKIKIYADGKLITPDEDKTVKGEYYNIYTYDLNNCDFIEIKMKKDINMIYTFLYVKDSEFKHDYSAIHYNEIFYGE